MKLKIKFEDIQTLNKREKEIHVWIYNKKLIDNFCYFFKSPGILKNFKKISVENRKLFLTRNGNRASLEYQFVYISREKQLIESFDVNFIKTNKNSLFIKVKQYIHFENEWNLKKEKVEELKKTIIPIKRVARKFISNFISYKKNENICDTCILRFNYQLNDFCNDSYKREL
jgi:hypothetical protein